MMIETAITHFFTQYQHYLALALFTGAALRTGAILGRRSVRKDRPRWYPHLPPLPAKPTTPLSELLDVAAYAVMAVVVVGLISNVLEGPASVLDGPVSESTVIFVLWLLAFGWFGYSWTTGEHRSDVHRYRYATDTAYRAEYEWRMKRRRIAAKNRHKWMIDDDDERLRRQNWDW